MNTFHTMSPIRYLRHRPHGDDGRNRCDWSNRCHRRDGCYGYRRDGRHWSHGRNGCNRCDWSNRCHRRDGCYGYGGYAAAVGLFHAKRARDSGQCVAV